MLNVLFSIRILLLTPSPPLRWCVGTWCCRDLCRCLDCIENTWDKNVIDWRWFGHPCTIVWLTTYTARQFRHRIVCRHLPVAPSTLVFHAVGRRASSSVLAEHEPDRRRADEPTPAGFASAATSASLPPAIQRRHAILLRASLFLFPLSSVTYSYRSYFRYSICPTVCLSVSRSKRWTFRTGTVISGIREHLSPFVIWAKTPCSHYAFRDGDSGYAFWEIDNREYTSWRTYSGDVHVDDVHVPVTYAFPWRTYFGDVRVMATYVFLTIYIYYRRTYSTDVRVLSTYVFYRRTWFVDVRIFVDVRNFSAYVFWRRRTATYVFRDNASEDGEHWRTLNSEYAKHSGCWILMKKILSDSFLRP